MANVKSTVISNRDAMPKIASDAFLDGGEVLSTIGSVQTASAADAVGSTYRLVQVPSNARVATVRFQCDNLGAGSALDMGVYYPSFIPVGAGLSASLAGSAIAPQFFMAAQSAAAALKPTDVTNQSGNNTISKQEMPLWQAIGLAADPGIMLDIVASVNVVLAAQGYLGAKCEYVKQ